MWACTFLLEQHKRRHSTNLWTSPAEQTRSNSTPYRHCHRHRSSSLHFQLCTLQNSRYSPPSPEPKPHGPKTWYVCIMVHLLCCDERRATRMKLLQFVGSCNYCSDVKFVGLQLIQLECQRLMRTASERLIICHVQCVCVICILYLSLTPHIKFNQSNKQLYHNSVRTVLEIEQRIMGLLSVII